MRMLFIALAVAFLSACSFVGFPGVYKIDVEQGNIVTQEMADQLKPGMSRRQVRFILGTPLIEDPFNQDRWDYPYVKRNGQNVISESLLTVVFEGDTLLDVTGDFPPAAWNGEPEPEEAAMEGDAALDDAENQQVEADDVTATDDTEAQEATVEEDAAPDDAEPQQAPVEAAGPPTDEGEA